MVDPTIINQVETRSITEKDELVLYGDNGGNITIVSDVGTFSSSVAYGTIDVGDIVFVGVDKPYPDTHIGTVVEKLGSSQVRFDSIADAAGAQFEVAKTRLRIGLLDPAYFDNPTGLSYLYMKTKKTYIGGDLEVEVGVQTLSLKVHQIFDVFDISNDDNITIILTSGGNGENITITTEDIVGHNTGIIIKANNDPVTGGTVRLDGRDIVIACTNRVTIEANSLLYNIAGDIIFSERATFLDGIDLNGGLEVSTGDLVVDGQDVLIKEGGDLTIIDSGSVKVQGSGGVQVTTGVVAAPKVESDLFEGESFKTTSTGIIEAVHGDIKTTGSGDIKTTGSGDIKTEGTGRISSAGDVLASGQISTPGLIFGGNLIATTKVGAPTVATDKIETYSEKTYMTFDGLGMPDYPERPVFFARQVLGTQTDFSYENSRYVLMPIFQSTYMQEVKMFGMSQLTPDDELRIEIPGIYEYDIRVMIGEAYWNGARITLSIHTDQGTTVVDKRSFYHPKASDDAVVSAHGFIELSENEAFSVSLFQISGRDRDSKGQHLYLKYVSKTY